MRYPTHTPKVFLRKCLWGFLCSSWLIILSPGSSKAQTHSDTLLSPKKVWLPWVAGGAAYAGGMVGLSQIWYTDTQSRFHFFNDNAQWKQLDKAGHFYSAYHLGRFGYDALAPTALSENTKLWLGGGLGFVLLFPIEILDGFSPDYGASWGDWGANLMGSLAFIAQQKWARQQLVQPKFSFRRSPWAALRPELLGDGLHEEWLKDYNGQTYWLSLDLHGLSGGGAFPKWLNLAVGYGANGMVHSRTGQNQANGFRAYRQYYLALDLDFSYLKPRSKVLRGLLWLINCIKIPTPALELRRGELRGRGLMF